MSEPFAHGGPVGEGTLRREYADFVVHEELGFSPDGKGTHAWLLIEKAGDNTHWVASRLADCAGLTTRAVGYAGMKDRRAVTRQWFSIDIAGRPMPDWRQLPSSLTPLLVTRSARKLRRGAHRGNAFRIRVRDARASSAALTTRLERLRDVGAPNYFGEQRFGHDRGNLLVAERLFRDRRSVRGRTERSMALSAARSHLFNQVLAERVRNGSWCRLLVGELPMSGGPGGVLPGRGVLRGDGMAAAIERDVMRRSQAWVDGLAQAGLDMERRALMCRPQGLAWRFQGNDLWVEFTLTRGQFATSVLREVVTWRQDSA